MKVRLLEASNLSIAYNKQPILANISFEIEEGEWVLIQGFNGEGKTTLIKTLLNLHPYDGSIKLKGKEIREYTINELHRLFSYLPQRLSHIPNISVSDFLSLYNGDKDRIVRRLNLAHLLDSSLTSLSLGQVQLILFAQAVLEDAEIIILDEPFSSIDSENKEIIYSTIKDMSLMGKTIILVSHEVERNYLPDRIITLSNSKSYDSPVLVKQRVNKEIECLPKLNTKPILIGLFILVIISCFIPSNTPILLRIVWCTISGGVFAFIGAVLQQLYKRETATPNTLGITSFSILGAVLPSLLGIASFLIDSLFAVICGLINGFFLIKRKTVTYGMIGGLGIVLSLLFYATNNPSYFHWIIGSFDIDTYFSLFLLPFILLPLLVIYHYSNMINALGIDADIARVHGIHPNRIRLLALGLSIIPIALTVSQTGLLFFVSMVIPLAITNRYGISLRKTLPSIFLLGSCFTLLSDIVTRIINHFTILETITCVTMFVLSIPLLITFSFLRGK